MKRKLMLTSILGIAVMFGFTAKVEANLQSKPGATPLRSISVSDFFIKTRNMEAAGESFGLQATINQSNGTETSSSNGIDVHMVKNTEYGTAVMLGASPYGSIPVARESQKSPNTITGNQTGMVMNQENNRWTFTASHLVGGNASYVTKLVAAQQRYWNQYVGTAYKKGDATMEAAMWKNAGYANWVDLGRPVFDRGGSGVFSFGVPNGYDYTPMTGNAYNDHGTRVCVVVSSSI